LIGRDGGVVWTQYINIRHLTPAEWVNTVTDKDGNEIRARLYYDKYGDIRVVCNNGSISWVGKVGAGTHPPAAAFQLATFAKQYTIMPFSQARDRYTDKPGNWPAPEEL
jgi:hypothetical protein